MPGEQGDTRGRILHSHQRRCCHEHPHLYYHRYSYSCSHSYLTIAQVCQEGEAILEDCILYSHEQIRKEAAAMGRADEQDAPWGIISVKPQDVDHELPMNPITMMRNALGAEEGGSGVGLVRAEYDKSVAFWSKHALIK